MQIKESNIYFQEKTMEFLYGMMHANKNGYVAIFG